MTREELYWDQSGRLRTLGPSTYKIPGSRDVPPVFETKILEGSPARADTIFRSKAVGEPPLMLATAVWNALCDATGARPAGQPRAAAGGDARQAALRGRLPRGGQSA